MARGGGSGGKRDMKRGELVVVSKPLAAVLRAEHLATHCSRCFISLQYAYDGSDAAHSPLVCEGCSFFTVCYDCARTVCKKESGPKVEVVCDDVFSLHRECGECFVLQEGDMLDTTTRMLLRLEYLRRKGPTPATAAKKEAMEDDSSKEGEEWKKEFEKLRGLAGLDVLEQHAGEKSEETLKRYAEYVRLVLARYRPVTEEGMDATDEGAVEIDEKVVAAHVGWLQAIQHNQHAIIDDLSGDMVGNMITTEGSMFNHSCSPNVTWSMRPDGLVRFVVAHDTPAGEPLCIPYVPEHTPLHHREALLQEKWRFGCDCKRCTGKDLSPADKLLVAGKEGLADAWRERNLGEELEEWVSEVVDREGAEVVTGARALAKVQELEKECAGVLADTHWSVLKLRAAAGNVLLALGEAGAAAEHFRALLAHSPDISAHSMSHYYNVKLARSLLAAASAETMQPPDGGVHKEAAEALGRALVEMKVLYGEHHWAHLVCAREKLAAEGRGEKKDPSPKRRKVTSRALEGP